MNWLGRSEYRKGLTARAYIRQDRRNPFLRVSGGEREERLRRVTVEGNEEVKGGLNCNVQKFFRLIASPAIGRQGAKHLEHTRTCTIHRAHPPPPAGAFRPPS